jgi:hypothetical protein
MGLDEFLSYKDKYLGMVVRKQKEIKGNGIN